MQGYIVSGQQVATFRRKQITISYCRIVALLRNVVINYTQRRQFTYYGFGTIMSILM